MASSKEDAFFFTFGLMAAESIIIKRKNPLRKAELPILIVVLFYFFLFFAMSGGQIGVMLSALFSLSNGVIGLTIAILGFAGTLILNMFQVSRIEYRKDALIARPRIGLSKRYDLNQLKACRMKWYDMGGKRFPFFQFNFLDEKVLQITGHQFKGLRAFILQLRDDLEGQLIEIK